jgi:hypothetical protein
MRTVNVSSEVWRSPGGRGGRGRGRGGTLRQRPRKADFSPDGRGYAKEFVAGLEKGSFEKYKGKNSSRRLGGIATCGDAEPEASPAKFILNGYRKDAMPITASTDIDLRENRRAGPSRIEAASAAHAAVYREINRSLRCDGPRAVRAPVR